MTDASTRQAGELLTDEHRVVAVVVTWNRRELLSESLAALEAQSTPLLATVVVDNASDDGTADDLRRRKSADKLDVVSLSRNTGGAGGFAAGIERALAEHRPQWLWLLDDDTVPTPSALKSLLAVAARAEPTPAVLASRVVWTDGRDHPMNTPREKPGVGATERAAATALGATAIRSASFVSVLCRADVIGERGLPVADYFLWNDDFEYTARLLRGNIGLYCPASVVVHKTKTFGSTDADPGERFYYEVRNKLWLFTRSRALEPSRRVLYAAATARRWLRTARRSPDRRTLARAFARGLRDGVRRGPRSNDDVLAQARVPRGEP